MIFFFLSQPWHRDQERKIHGSGGVSLSANRPVTEFQVDSEKQTKSQADPKAAGGQQGAVRKSWALRQAGRRQNMHLFALLLAFLHVREGRSETRRIGAHLIVAILALAVGVSTIITVYRIGDSGAQSVWGNELSETTGK